MKGVKWIKWRYYVGFALGLVLCFLLNFGLVKRSNAVDFTVSVNPTGNHWETGTDLKCTQDVNRVISVISANAYGECNSFDTSLTEIYLRNIYLNRTIPAVENNYYSFFLGFETVQTLQNVTWNLNTSSDWTIFEFKEVVSDQMLDSCYSWATGSANVPYICQTYGEQWKSKYYQVTLKANRTGDLTVILGNMTGNPRTFMVIPTFGGSQLSMSSIFEFEPSALEKMNEKDDEDRSNIESQQGETDSSAEGSTEDINEGTTNLIGALSSFFTTMSNVSAGNCTLPEITAYGVSLGQLNLCTYSPPTWVQTALSVIVSIIAIRLAYAIFKRIIKIVKSFTGGNG